jgi:digeranylgeranylglycerophospholipid reductase
MKNVGEVAVVGAGPAGSFAALKLAQSGLVVTVYEEHKEIGVPSHCAGHLSIQGLRRLGMYPLPSKIVENTYRGAIFHSPGGESLVVSFDSPVTCAVNRALFDRYLAEKAQEAGAKYSLNSRVANLAIESGVIKGVVVRQSDETVRKAAGVVIDAEGVSSRILRGTGIQGLDTDWLVNGVEAEVENLEVADTSVVEVFLGGYYAPGFYAWLMPKGDGRGKIGLAAKGGNPEVFLRRLMFEHPVASQKLGRARITRVAFHPITLGGPIRRPCSDGFLAVGDAASQVKSTTGGGVVFGMTCAAICAQVVKAAVLHNDFSSDFLSRYPRACDRALGFDSRMMVRMRRLLDGLSDESFDSLIGLCSRFGVEKAFQGVEDVDFQGRSLLRFLRSPRALAALGCFFFSFLSTNL